MWLCPGMVLAQKKANDCFETNGTILKRMTCLCHARGNRDTPHYHLFAVATFFQQMAHELATRQPHLVLPQWILREQSELYYQDFINSSPARDKSHKDKARKLQQALRPHFATHLPLKISPSARWTLEGRHHTCKSTDVSSPHLGVIQCRIFPAHLPTSVVPTSLHSCFRTARTIYPNRNGFALPPGAYLLRVEQPGFVPHYQQIVLQDQQIHPVVSIKLKPLLASLQVISQPAGAAVTLQGQGSGYRKMAQSPHVFSELQPGKYQISMKHPLFPIRQESLQLCGGCKHAYTFSLSPPKIKPSLPPPTPSPKFRSLSVSFSVVTGLVALSLAGGITTGILGKREQDWAASFAYYSTTWRTSYETGQQLSTASHALFIASGVLGATSIALLIALLRTPDTVILTQQKNPPPADAKRSSSSRPPLFQRHSFE